MSLIRLGSLSRSFLAVFFDYSNSLRFYFALLFHRILLLTTVVVLIPFGVVGIVKQEVVEYATNSKPQARALIVFGIAQLKLHSSQTLEASLWTSTAYLHVHACAHECLVEVRIVFFWVRRVLMVGGNDKQIAWISVCQPEGIPEPQNTSPV